MVTMTVREALRDAMAEEMRRDGDVFVMGEEVAEYQGAYKITQGLLQEFGAKRVVDTPITEHGFAGMGVGAAMAGLKPIIEFMTFNFAMQAIDQIINSAAKTLTCPAAGAVLGGVPWPERRRRARRRPAQPGLCGLVQPHPGLKVVAPYTAATPRAAQGGIRDPNRSSSLRTRSSTATPSRCRSWMITCWPIGKARIARAGKDVTLVSWSIGMTYTLKAAEELAKQGIEAEVIDLRTIRPMDVPTIIESVKKTGRCVTVEEGWPQSGVGSEIAASSWKRRSTISTLPCCASPARMCPCRMRQSRKSSRCRTSPR